MYTVAIDHKVKELIAPSNWRNIMNRLTHTKSALVQAFVLAFTLSISQSLPAADAGKTLYRWVDENGHVQYSDQLPPKYAPAGHDVISTTGATKERIPKAKTKEEIEKAKAEAAAREKIDAEKASKDAADRRLREAYGSADSIRKMLAEKTVLIDSSISLSENRIKKLEGQLAKLNAEAARMERSGNAASDEIKKDMIDINNQIDNQKKSIADQRAEQARLKAQFEADLRRYIEITTPATPKDQSTNSNAASTANQSPDSVVGK